MNDITRSPAERRDSAPRSPFAALRLATLAAAVALAALQLSCASAGFSPDPHTMPAARSGLRPEYRVFYDELNSYGDWILIEPYGFVFRPRPTFDNWSPYWDGFWSPSDSYGWVWVSAEPFGWATYHYGRWFHDDYQRWVWVPGLEWAPAWVSWSASDQYVGWAALAPNGGSGGNWNATNPGTNYMYVPRGELGATDLRNRILSQEQSKSVGRQAPIQNIDKVDAVVLNRGPRIEWVESVAGPLQRAKVEEFTRVDRKTPAPVFDPPQGAETKTAPPAPQTMKQDAEEQARQVRSMMKQKQAPPEVIPVLKPPPPAATAPAKGAPAPAAPKKDGAPRDSKLVKPAARDTTP